MRPILTGGILLVLSACQKYAVTLNHQPLYTPPPLYSDFWVEDQALATCLKQTIIDQNVVRPEQLKTIYCRHAGLLSVVGLEHFTGLEEVDLSHNRLRSVRALAELKQLRTLKLDENPDLICADLSALEQVNLQITAPDHCGT